MRRALELARAGARRGEVPVGAIVLDPAGTVVAEASNRTREWSDPTAFDFSWVREVYRQELPDGTDVCVTLEPCAMCVGAAVLARLPRLVFGAFDPKAGMCGSLEDLARDPRLNHRIEVVPGVLGDACGAVLSEFFRARRAETRLR